MNEKISIIVPVYNLEKYIAQTLDSICSQTYRNIEIVVVDDGSSDNSYQIICDYSQRDSRVIPIHQENGGVTSARLNGVKHATGKWIGFCDGDDQIDEDTFAFLISNAYKYEADISHCGYRMIFEDGRVNRFYGTGCTIEQDRLKGLIDLLDGEIIEPGLWNKLFKKTLFVELLNNGIDPSIKNNEDLLMNFILFKEAKKSVFVDECKYQYWVRQGSASRRISEHTIYDPIRVKEIICQLAPKEIEAQAKAAYLSTCINTYGGLVVNNASRTDLHKVLSLIKAQKQNMNLLGNRNRLLMKLILFSPKIYKFVYSIYSNYFQKKKYS